VSRLFQQLGALGRSGAGRVAAVVGALLALALAAALFIGAPHVASFFESANAFAAEPAYAFASPLVEQAVRLHLNKPRSRITNRDLRAVTELNLCGETPFARWEDLDSRGRALLIGGAPSDSPAVLDDVSDFANMPNLQRLSLYRLSIQNIDFLRGLPLTHLGLGGNRIRDLNALTDFKLLRELDVSDNPVGDLDALSSCPSLQALDISATGVIRLSPLGGMHLRSLELYDMPGGTDYEVLRQLNGLEAFGANLLPEEAVEAVEGMTQLSELSLPGSGIRSLSAFQNMRLMTSLNLSGNKITSLSGVEALKNLQSLDVSGNQLTDLDPMRGHSGVESLSIARNALKDLSALQSMPGLVTVVVSEDQQKLIDSLSGDNGFSIQKTG